MIVDSSPKFSGEPTAEALSNGLATLGRYGDNYMVHAAEGETIIPKEILEANPGLKDDLFRQMTMMGIRNPNRYVVGSDLNSINPITGQPEFFFKKLWKATKKIGKKILPVLAPIIGNMIAPGIGGLIASGLVTKMQGGSWGDAAKSAALAYGVGALGRGMQSFTSGKGFISGLGSGLTEPWRAGSKLFASGPANPLQQGIFGSGKYSGELFPRYQDTGTSAASSMTDRNTTENVTDYDAAMEEYYGTSRSVVAADPALPPGVTQRGGELFLSDGTKIVQKSVVPVGYEIASKEPGWVAGLIGEKGADVLGKVASNVAGPLGTAALVYYLSEDEQSTADQLAQLDAANPRRVAFDQWQNIADKDSPEARALKAQWYGQPSYTGTQLASSFGANPLVGITPGTLGAPGGSDPSDLTWIPGIDGPIQPPTLRVNESPHPLGTGPFGELGLMGAAGGEVMGRGTGTSDSIPARLSDGEFVMTAEAVRNAGGGNRALGAARMYDMMNRFERGAA